MALLGKPPGTTEDAVGFSQRMFFVAGFSPRLVVGFVEGVVRKVYLAQVTPQSMPARVLPINQVLGIGPSVEERLAEEGIEDATSLAMADPVRLLRILARQEDRFSIGSIARCS